MLRLTITPTQTYFNPRAPCGARRYFKESKGGLKEISIHAPLAGRDLFQIVLDDIWVSISIHAPLAGRDS